MSEKTSNDIVYIGYSPLTVKAANDFFINDLLLDNRKVEYWDLSIIYFPNVKYSEIVDGDWVKKISSIKLFKKFLSEKNVNTIFFINFPFNYRVLRIYLLLSRRKANLTLIAKGMIPLPSRGGKQFARTLLSVDAFKNIKMMFLNRFSLFLKLFGLIKTFDRIYYSGDESLKIAGLGYTLDVERAELIAINSSDYDKYLQIIGKESMGLDKYVVFLDEYFPFHPDFLMFATKVVDSEEYYESINQFFFEIEQRYNVKVIIAAHPKAEKYHSRNFFNGREVFFNRTAELVKDSEFVLAHMSTSISFSVLFKKPIAFITTDGLIRNMPFEAELIAHMANVLNCVCYNTNQYSFIGDMTFDNDKYSEYKYSYLTSTATENIKSSDIFLNSI